MAVTDAGGNPGCKKASPIIEESVEKAQLIKLFQSKQCKRFPSRKKDDDLEELMKKKNQKLSQVAHHFSAWFCLDGRGSLPFERSKEGVMESLHKSCHTVDELLK
jgi:hypothetical protein